jgi:ketosteroid isomerase-like protein
MRDRAYASGMTRENAERFAAAWLAAWNAHDLDAILEHYADDVVFTSPFVVELAGRADGTLRGKAELRSYFERGLAAFPDLRFRDLEVRVGAASVCLLYRSVRDLPTAETMVLDEAGQVVRVFAHYGE